MSEAIFKALVRIECESMGLEDDRHRIVRKIKKLKRHLREIDAILDELEKDHDELIETSNGLFMAASN